MIILERCQDLQIYLKFGFKSRTWIVIFNVRSWRVVYPRKKKRFMEISFNWLFYKYLPQFLSFKCFLHPPKNFWQLYFFLSWNQIISLTCSYWWSTCADPEYFSTGRVLRIILLCELSKFEVSMAAGGMSGLPDTSF